MASGEDGLLRKRTRGAEKAAPLSSASPMPRALRAASARLAPDRRAALALRAPARGQLTARERLANGVGSVAANALANLAGAAGRDAGRRGACLTAARAVIY